MGKCRFTLPEGFRIQIRHFDHMNDPMGEERKFTEYKKPGNVPVDNIVPRSTKATIIDEQGNVMAEATAYCSNRDTFNRKIGRHIATGRALKQFAYRRAMGI